MENLTDTVKITSSSKNHTTCYNSQFKDLDDQPCEMLCLLCDTSFNLPSNEQGLLTHLFNEHRLVIGDVDKIASLKSYIRYWRVKFKEEPLTTFCTTLTMSNSDSGSADEKSQTGEFYFLLSDCLMEDRTLRDDLRQAKLEWVLTQQVEERADTTFKKGCMFCRTEFSGSRVEYLKHLYQKHNILLGKPENLVFIDEYLDKIQNNIENFICIYCEKKFKNRLVLKEHMRKKLHKQVNPNNKSYDKYYITNYSTGKFHDTKQKSTKTHSPEQEDPSGFSSENEDENWSDWDDGDIVITCLFCGQDTQDFNTTLQHMKSSHGFDFMNASRDFTFYQKVKIVNYVRKQIHSSQCVYCDEKADDLSAHMDEKNHYKLPEKRIWDQPEFYFPMFESDPFLYNLDANSDNEEIIS